jgi:hypothetical protein
MKSGWRVFSLILITVLLGSCRSGNDQPGVSRTAIPESPIPDHANGDMTGQAAGGVISQWGSSAEASSEFANPEWSASQAVGRPDAPGCGDYQFAWASAASDSIETLEVTFLKSVYPFKIYIYESFNPDQVVKVEVLNPETGAYYTVMQKNPVPVDRPCPYELAVAVEGIDFKTDQVRITVDQSQLGLGWNEIDAVQLLGTDDPPEQ